MIPPTPSSTRTDTLLPHATLFRSAGRAAQDAGDATQANLFLGRAGAYADQFYGQLALERLGRAIPVPAATLPVQVTEAERTQFYNRGVVQAVRVLGQQGQWQDRKSTRLNSSH